MIALGLSFICVICLFAVALAIVKLKGWHRTVVIVLLLFPLIYVTWDMPVGYFKYRNVCRKEGGIRILATDLSPTRVLKMEDHYNLSLIHI